MSNYTLNYTGEQINSHLGITLKAAASGGTDESLVTTGEKYTWNNKYTKPSTGIPDSDIVSAATWNAKLSSHQTIKQDGVTGATATRFGTCSTAASTAAKTVSITSGTFTLGTGARVTVKFSYTNTANNPTLNVNSKGAKNIFHNGSQITTDSNIALLAGTVDFVYDGTQWQLVGNYLDSNYDSKTAASGGTELSLVTTGEKATWNAKTSNTGTVTSVATGVGLTGGSITTSGTIKAKLRSETALINDSAAATETSGRVYPVAVDKTGYLAVNVPWTDNNTDTKVTSATNHYTPSTDANSELTASLSGTAGSYALNTEYTVLTGVKAQRDTKGHITGLTYTAQKIKDTNTTYSTLTKDLIDAGTETTSKLVTAKVLKDSLNSYIAANDAMVFKGTIGTDGTITTLPATHNAGWTYKVITAGTYAGKVCEVGDMIICITDGTATNDNHWDVIQTNVDGAVVGPASSTAGHIATFTGVTGKVIQDSGFTIAKSVPANAVFTDTTYENKTAASGGTDVSLVSTGEKYNWNNKQAKITASGILKGNGNGSVSAATAGTDYASPLSVPSQASIGTTGLISFKNSSGTQIFTIQLPIYNGGVA